MFSCFSCGDERPKDITDVALDEAKRELKKNRGRSVRDTYNFGQVLGKGGFGKVYLATHKYTKHQYAVKQVEKRPERWIQEALLLEIAVQRRACAAIPQAVKLVEVYEDGSNTYLVLELCAGGEVFDRIIDQGNFCERDAAQVLRALLGFIAALHGLGVAHRDIKPMNMLLTCGPTEPITAADVRFADFGLSAFCADGDFFHQTCGTIYFQAPEVVGDAAGCVRYDKAADVWAAGVTLFVLLCGWVPFGGRFAFKKTELELRKIIRAGKFSFTGLVWEVVSDSAKDIIAQMLQPDPNKRPSAAQLLSHPWFTEAASLQRPLGERMIANLKQFAAACRLQKLAALVVAKRGGGVGNSLSPDVAKLREVFAELDANGDRRLTFDELKDEIQKVRVAMGGATNGAAVVGAKAPTGGSSKAGGKGGAGAGGGGGGGPKLDEQELWKLFLAADFDGDGKLDVNEFVAAMMNAAGVSPDEKTATDAIFDEVDVDGDGFLTPAEVQLLLPASLTRDEATAIVQQADKNADGRVSRQELEEALTMSKKHSQRPAGETPEKDGQEGQEDAEKPADGGAGGAGGDGGGEEAQTAERQAAVQAS
ncbi:hypothetical protein HYH02_000556 [Chlamydomonas schloesseri]|uniref:Uncharacterized protein n=1 Tax=Chlamydomonas schloesseri TaxID=2026947 RepID=A0A836BDG2_9CHLO|nr:hypothetical protein HYH02_000556 [Chlamydomonas schloesseri]|eukprot:KAG2454719.1 hypothetical protein HYH02_000556 [Chlamydomonas schloesseri]